MDSHSPRPGITNPSVQKRKKKSLQATTTTKKKETCMKTERGLRFRPQRCEFPSAHPVVLQQGGVSVLAARLLYKQFLTGGLVLIQHALPRVDHPVGGERKIKATGLPHEKRQEKLKNAYSLDTVADFLKGSETAAGGKRCSKSSQPVWLLRYNVTA